MLKDRIRFISAQPDAKHFVWQTQVYLQNFHSLGIPLHNCVALFGVEPGKAASRELRALRARLPAADIRVYEDTRGADGRAYAPSIQPHLIEKALRDSPEWSEELTFFQDCDVAFRRLPDFDRMLREHPRACLLSDTRDYIGFEHLHERCEEIRAEKPEVPVDELIHKMCEIVGIDIEVVRKNEAGSGGAQYLLQGAGPSYWQKVYRDSIAIRRLFDDYLGSLGLGKAPKDYIQVWTAGMWAYLWNLWWSGLETVVHPELGFLFSGAPSKEPEPILHMAGLADELKHSHYDKEDWWELSPVEVLPHQPYLFDHIPEQTVGREYATFIAEAAGVRLRGLQPLAPAQRWRLLAWKGESKRDIWDVEQLHLRFEPGASIVGHLQSGSAGPDYEVAHAFEPSAGYWGGRPEHRDGARPCLYLGVELDRPALPEKIAITQRDGPHGARIVVLQYCGDASDWVTALVAKLDPRLVGQTILYRSSAGHRARGWRVVAHTTSTDFAWDVLRLRFLRESVEELGTPCSSGFAHRETPSDYGPENAFHDDAHYWGGRADAGGQYFLGVEGGGQVEVNRVVLEQGDTHWAASVEIQALAEDGLWRTFRVAENLGPGINDMLLFEVADRTRWVAPRIDSRRGLVGRGS